MNKDLRLNMFMMMKHLGDVMDGDATLNILELWQWMDEVLHVGDDFEAEEELEEERDECICIPDEPNLNCESCF